MSELTPDEIHEIKKAMSQKGPRKEDKIPLRPPVSRVALSPIIGEKPRPLSEITDKEMQAFENLKVKLEVVYGKTRVSLKELAALKQGNLLVLEELCDDLVDLYVNGLKIGRGEIVFVEGRFGVKIHSFTKN